MSLLADFFGGAAESLHEGSKKREEEKRLLAERLRQEAAIEARSATEHSRQVLRDDTTWGREVAQTYMDGQYKVTRLNNGTETRRRLTEHELRELARAEEQHAASIGLTGAQASLQRASATNLLRPPTPHAKEPRESVARSVAEIAAGTKPNPADIEAYAEWNSRYHRAYIAYMSGHMPPFGTLRPPPSRPAVTPPGSR